MTVGTGFLRLAGQRVQGQCELASGTVGVALGAAMAVVANAQAAIEAAVIKHHSYRDFRPRIGYRFNILLRYFSIT